MDQKTTELVQLVAKLVNAVYDGDDDLAVSYIPAMVAWIKEHAPNVQLIV